MTIQNYALVNISTGICENVIMWDGRTEPIEITEPEVVIDENGNPVETGNRIVIQTIAPWQPPANCNAVNIEGLSVGIGWQLKGGIWTDIRIESTPETLSNSEA